MTAERAIEILDPTHREHYDSLETVQTACRMGMQALEKQIPKKPVSINDDSIGCFNDDKKLACPNCKKPIINVWSKSKYNPHFCHYCGQALDWNEKAGE